MKVAILSKADRFGGGASRVAAELCQLLNAKGHTAHHYISSSQSPVTDHQKPLHGSFFLNKIIRRLNHFTKILGFPELVPWELFFLWLQKIESYDLIHFHDLSSAISPLTVKYLARILPTIWTFHDCSPFTGGCLYPVKCERFKTRCGKCPQLGTWPIDSELDFTGFMQDIKRKTVLENNFVAIAPSKWMADMAMTSGMYSSPPLVIPNGVDTNLFKPIDKLAIRKKLELPTNRHIILLIASDMGETRKGIRYALEALTRSKQLKPLILLVGQPDEQSRSQFGDLEYIEAGYIKDEQTKAAYFATADLFLFCSLADNMPLVILETMAVATPTVGFVTGGVREMIEHDHSGYLVPQKDIDGLARGIHLGLSDKRAAFWGQQARERVEKLFSYEIFLKNHLNLYETVVKDFKKRN